MRLKRLREIKNFKKNLRNRKVARIFATERFLK
ncbi:hypothetical protein NIASO_06870 [Niabella soli DSM 19437]|uniref:Uncharacterized protein n=1 Tax=Niabella soli DSM 19437 TaxID=929713 RepID=W0F2Z6_9BACT|nr:hypothetical protein NIASO_06870 [Niabella soli DSM 19437]